MLLNPTHWPFNFCRVDPWCEAVSVLLNNTVSVCVLCVQCCCLSLEHVMNLTSREAHNPALTRPVYQWSVIRVGISQLVYSLEGRFLGLGTSTGMLSVESTFKKFSCFVILKKTVHEAYISCRPTVCIHRLLHVLSIFFNNGDLKITWLKLFNNFFAAKF